MIFLDLGGLSDLPADVVELRAANLYRGGRASTLAMRGEYIGNTRSTTHRPSRRIPCGPVEALAYAGILHGNHQAFVHLDTHRLAFDDLEVDLHRITDIEAGGLVRHL
jgi:hypothetical protein